MSDFGLAIARDNKSMSGGSWQFDSRKKKWTVDLNANPKHVRLFEMDGGTKFVRDKAIAGESEETLFEMEHKMPWPPKFLVYFYATDAPSAYADLVTGYQFNKSFMRFNAGSEGSETVYAMVDDKYFYIKHNAQTPGSGSGNTTFHGSDWKYRVKLEILNQKAIFLSAK